MNRKIKLLIYLGMLFISAVLLSKVAQVLDQMKHPLVSSLTCIETGDVSDLYWKINQITLSGGINRENQSIVIGLRNNIPNFDSYLFRLDGNEQWKKLTDGKIYLDAGGGSHTIELKATNVMEGELPPMVRTIQVRDNAVIISPNEGKIENGSYLFRFEKPGSAKVAWLREYTLPVITACPNQWSTFLTLRTWVSQQIPNKYPAMKSHWDAQRILQAVWNDPSLGFICDAYAATYVSACASVGHNARMIHLGDGDHNGHYAAEVWSDGHKKWIFMDPLYDCHFTLTDTPLSAIELHNLWKQDRMREIATNGAGGVVVKGAAPSRNYLNLFQDIQLVNSNDFLSTPFTSVMDILTLKIRFLRYIDETNPPYNRVKLVYRLLMFYYLPILISGLIIPFVIPAFMIIMTMMLGRKQEGKK